MSESSLASASPSPPEVPSHGLPNVQATRPIRLWRRVPLRWQMLYGFALPVLIVLLASTFLVRGLDTVQRAATAAVGSSEAIGLRYALLNAILDAETGERGYLLSGAPEFLEPYTRGPVEMAPLSQRLEITDGAKPAHLARIHQIQALFRQWHDEFADPLIALRRQSPPGLASELQHLQEFIAADSTFDRVSVLSAQDRIERLMTALDPGVASTQQLRRLVDQIATGTPPNAGTRAELRTLTHGYQAAEERITGIVQSKRGKRLIDKIRAVMAVSLQDELTEQRRVAAVASASALRVRWIALLAPVTALLLGLTLMLLLLVDAIRSIRATTKAAEIVAGGDLGKRINVIRGDELGQLGHAFNRMASELADERVRSRSLDRFQTLLTTSNSTEELFQVVERMCRDSFPGASGAIYRIAASRNMAEMTSRWNWPDAADGRVMDPAECRALRTGQPYLATGGSLEVPCRHTDKLGVVVGRSLCLPLAAQGEILGVLQLCEFGAQAGEAPARHDATAILIGEQFAMALANLQLREQLRNQSIRDPLTGLFNRRYLEETMERELARSARNGQSLAVLAIDVDHFKRFNDTHGHEAGDRVLVELAALMRAAVRTTDIACRYGGEEFVLLMPDSPIEVALQRAEALCQQARNLRLRFGVGELEAATISIGIAVAPVDGTRADVLLRNADTALYAAKAGGRDRVVVYRAP